MNNEKDNIFDYIGKEYLSIFFSLTQNSDENDADEFEEITYYSPEIPHFHPNLIAKSKHLFSMYMYMNTPLKLEDKKRFLAYITLFDYEMNGENLGIKFTVISTAEKTGVIHYKNGSIDDFKINVVNICDFGFDETVNMALDKIRHKEVLNGENLVKLALTSIMPESKQSVKDQFYVLLDMMDEIIFENKEAGDSFAGILMLLANMYFGHGDDSAKEIRRAFMNKIHS